MLEIRREIFDIFEFLMAETIEIIEGTYLTNPSSNNQLPYPQNISGSLSPEFFNESFCMNFTFILIHNLTEECTHLFGSPLPMGLMTIIQIFYGLVCMVGLCGNTLVIYVVLRYSKMQTVTNMYILNLALADECFLVGIPFLIVTSYLGDWPFGMEMCKIYLTTTSINQFTSSIFLTVMSADRYIAVCHPISSPKYRTPVIARCVSLTAWTASAMLMVPVFMYAATITKPTGGQSCNIFWPFEESEDLEGEEGEYFSQGGPRSYLNGQTAFTFYSFVLGFAIPLILILIFYVLVIVKLKTVGPKNKSKVKKRSHRKVTRLVLTVITVYILCWLPYWITQLALIFTPPGHNQDNVVVAVMLLAGCLSYSNSAMNPVLYAFLSENFKKSFMKACTCVKGREVNAALHVDNSMFPRRRNHRKTGDKKNKDSTGRSNNKQSMRLKDSNIASAKNGGLLLSGGDQNSHGKEAHELHEISVHGETKTHLRHKSL
ncbi:ASTC-R [Lepeophtheirus salmonis]|uniref:ASTC-R n=1 Tax=Lepeophtheirus salmonis TaxID=72036 RepID=A0A7R8HA40_LEPSM|nr:ASTC-R [Lepeophtheirus salmonis]CAF2966530.1 ASTC-R [Lepeophtheirus salmonis]